jgi:hypothetical protein
VQGQAWSFPRFRRCAGALVVGSATTSCPAPVAVEVAVP